MAGADVLVLLSDVDGLYTANPRIDPAARRLDTVTAITPEIEAMAGGTGSSLSRGGMKTKIIAARTAVRAGCAMAITFGAVDRPLTALADGAPCTWFEPDGDPHAARKRWISGMKPRGRVTVDAGAVAALGRGKSLLARRRHRGRRRLPARRPDRDQRPRRRDGRPGARGLRCSRGATHHGPPLGPDRRAPRPPGPGRARAPRRPGALGGTGMDVRLDVKSLMQDIGEKAKAAAADLAFAPSAQKDAALVAAAAAIAADRAALLAANATDMELRRGAGPRRRDARPAAADRGARRRHRRRPPRHRRPARPGRSGDRRMGPPLGPAHPPGPHADRGDRRDLREPPERHRRRRRALPQGRQRRDPARRLREPALVPRDPRRPRRRPRRRRPPRDRDPARPHQPTAPRSARCWR